MASQSYIQPLPIGGTSLDYLSGDKRWELLSKDAVGLSNVDNTDDLSKPISNQTLVALGRRATLVYTVNDLRNTDVQTNQVFFLTEVGREGFWYWDEADTTSADNTGTILVSYTNKRYKRYYINEILSSWFDQTNVGFQKFIDASEGITGVINKTIVLSAQINLKPGTLSQVSGVTVYTNATTGFRGFNIQITFRDIFIRTQISTSVNILMELESCTSYFYNVVLGAWKYVGLNLIGGSIYGESLRIIGMSAADTLGSGLVMNGTTRSFLNGLEVDFYGLVGIKATSCNNIYFSNIIVSDGGGVLNFNIIDSDKMFFTNMVNYSGPSNLTDTGNVDNSTSVRFLNCTFPNHVRILNTTSGITFTGCVFNKVYQAEYDTVKFIDCKINNKFTETKGTAQVTADGTGTAFNIVHNLPTTPKYVNVTAGSANARGDFLVAATNISIIINYVTAPPAGTLTLNYKAEL